MLKLIGSIIGGVVIAFVIVFATEFMFRAMTASVAAPDPADKEAMRLYVASLPVSAMLAVLAGWTVAVFAGSAFAARFGGRGTWPGWVVGGVFLAATAANFLMITHPTWMVVSAVVLIVAGSWSGSRLGAGMRPPAGA